MLRHIFQQNLKAGTLFFSQNAQTNNGSVLCYKKKDLGYTLLKNNYCSSEKLIPRDTVSEVKKKIQEELDTYLEDPEYKNRYERLLHLIEMMRYQGKPVPSVIAPASIIMLLQQSERGKQKLLEVLFKRECVDKRIAEEKQKTSKFNENHEKLQIYDGEQVFYGLHRNALFMRFYKKSMNNFLNYRAMYAMLFEQPLVFDVDYHDNMTYRETVACAKQIGIAFAHNRLHRLPFHMYLCGADRNTDLMKNLYTRIPIIYDNDFPISMSSKPVTEVFDKSKLVYLTPHTNKILTCYNPDDIYIIGGIVDKAVNVPLSLAKAKKEGIRTARLPLDEYMSWGYGNKSLTLNQVLQILLEYRVTNNWHQAFKFVPRRKLYGNVENIQRRSHMRKHLHLGGDTKV